MTYAWGDQLADPPISLFFLLVMVASACHKNGSSLVFPSQNFVPMPLGERKNHGPRAGGGHAWPFCTCHSCLACEFKNDGNSKIVACMFMHIEGIGLNHVKSRNMV